MKNRNFLFCTVKIQKKKNFREEQLKCATLLCRYIVVFVKKVSIALRKKTCCFFFSRFSIWSSKTFMVTSMKISVKMNNQLVIFFKGQFHPRSSPRSPSCSLPVAFPRHRLQFLFLLLSSSRSALTTTATKVNWKKVCQKNLSTSIVTKEKNTK